jgi:hypothetical protein
MDPKKTPRTYDVSPKQFVLAWQGSNSLKEVTSKTGIPESICSARAAQLRRIGVQLKQMPRGRTKGGNAPNVEELNKLIAEMGGPAAPLPVPKELEDLTQEEIDRRDAALTERNQKLIRQVLGTRPSHVD